MIHLIEFAIFAGKAFVIIIGIIAIIMTIAGLALKNKPEIERIIVKNLNKKFNKFTQRLKQEILPKKDLKKFLKLSLIHI